MKKRRSIRKPVNRLLTGLTISWCQPASTAFTENSDGMMNAKISHRNPVYRMTCDEIWRRYGGEIYRKLKMLWRVQITAVFQTESGDTIDDDSEFIEFMLLRDLVDVCQPVIDEKLVEVHFHIEIIGNREKKESDFKI